MVEIDIDKLVFKLLGRQYDTKGNKIDIIDNLKILFQQVAPHLNIGKITIDITRTVNSFSTKLINENFKLYEVNEYDENNQIDFIHEIDPIGDYHVRINIIKDHTITNEEKENINKLIYLCCGMIERYYGNLLHVENQKIDNTTGYSNPQGISEFIDRLKEQDILDNYVTLCTNIRDFKIINQKMDGDDLGNLVLRRYADIIFEALDEDEVIGRIYVDNFLIVIKKENFDQIKQLLDNMIIKVNVDGIDLAFDIKSVIGYYCSEKDDSYEDIREYALFAMKTAKSIPNTNILECDQLLKDKMEFTKFVKDRFKNSQNSESIVPFYQPKVDINTRELYSAEALTRWFDDDGNMIPPAEFIPILEQTGDIVKLDFMMLDRVCVDIKNNLLKGIKPVPISVNFSRYHFVNKDDTDFVQNIIDTINKHEIDPKYIEIEITEAGNIKDDKLVSDFVEKLHTVGIKVSMDDFGKGYSSQSSLAHVPYDIIKIDKTFIDEYKTSTVNIILKHTINMMKELDKIIVCEGIEDEDQIEYLKTIGCSIVQGYYFDKPLPKNEYEKRLIIKQYDKGK